MEESWEGDEQETLYEHQRWVVDPGQAILRIDKFLSHRMENTSRNRIQKAADAGFLLVNQAPVKSNYRVKPGDVVSLSFPTPPFSGELQAEDLPLDILFEDAHLMVINKAAGMVVHPGVGNHSGTLVNALLHHFKSLPGMEAHRPGLVHRLDKDTSGVMVIAKTEEAMTMLAKQFFERTSRRRYLALIWGTPKEEKGSIVGHIGRDPKNRQHFTVFPDGREGKHAVTHYELVESLGFVSLVHCRLETGRTHQIRVHMKHLGHPLFNDPFYGGNAVLRGENSGSYKSFVQNCFQCIPGQGLHAEMLGFQHPATGEMMEFSAEPPEGMRELLQRWRNFAQQR
ncbi:MAG: RluA family pseudouridine synthase [Bacteroidetes bacterium]|nr:RluA family pseudouridine synthase [Bacteroidota bacterium]